MPSSRTLASSATRGSPASTATSARSRRIGPAKAAAPIAMSPSAAVRSAFNASGNRPSRQANMPEAWWEKSEAKNHRWSP